MENGKNGIRAKKGTIKTVIRTVKQDEALIAKDEKIKELTELLQHLQADFENYRKRVEAEKTSLIKNSNRGLIARLLPILDSFELALKNKKEKEEFIKGIELIYAQFYAVLEKEGLKKIEANSRFDPKLHEALMLKECSQEDGTIIEELQSGYVLDGCVIRPSRVIISKKAVQDETKADHNNN